MTQFFRYSSSKDMREDARGADWGLIWDERRLGDVYFLPSKYKIFYFFNTMYLDIF
jgi:hypothetical protein